MGKESFDKIWYRMGVFLLNKLNVFLGIPVKVNISGKRIDRRRILPEP